MVVEAGVGEGNREKGLGEVKEVQLSHIQYSCSQQLDLIQPPCLWLLSKQGGDEGRVWGMIVPNLTRSI